MGRSRYRYNAKARSGQTQKTDKSTEQQHPNVDIALDVRSEKYDSSNPLVVLPSSTKEKKEKKHKNAKYADKKEKPLSKKEKIRLKKILEKKNKNVDRSELLEKLKKVQATPNELLQMTSTSFMQTSGHKKSTTESESPRIIVNNIKGSKNNLNAPPKKKIKLDPNIIGFENYDSDSSSTTSEEDQIEVDDKVSSEIIAESSQNNIETIEESKTTISPENKVDPEKNEGKNLSTVSTERKLQNMQEKIPHVPAVFVPVHRTPEIQAVREALPIYSEEHAIMEAITENPIVVIHGATGTGKTTQLPQFLYEAGYTRNGMKIGITEPRRIAAVQVAARVANEMNLPDAVVSYHIRYEKNVDDQKTEIKFMTDGILLKEMRHDFLLSKYSVIIIDEAHERSIFSDVLIGLLSRVLPLRKKKNSPLKLVIMSATLRVEDFTENRRLFKEKPFLITLDARQYDVVIHFNTKTPDDYVQGAFEKICQIHKKLPAGSILAFVTGEKEVTRLCRLLRRAFPFKDQSKSSKASNIPKENLQLHEGSRKPKPKKQKSDDSFTDMVPNINLDGYTIEPLDYEGLQHQDSDTEDLKDDEFHVENQLLSCSEPLFVLPLFSHLSTSEQAKVFQPPPEGSRLCVIATDVAETSVTIPGLKYVVDTGKVKTRVYDKISCGISNFSIIWTSKASANQRAGRAGRTEGGHCYRLYSSSVFEHDFPDFTPPDIQRIPVDDMLLQMKVLGIDRVVNFPFPTAPDIEALKAAEKRLVMLGALQDLRKCRRFKEMVKWEYSAKITDLGQAMSRFPLSPRYSKMLLLAYKHEVVSHTIAAVSAMTVPEVFTHSNLQSNAEIEEDKVEDSNTTSIKKIGAGQGKSLKLGDVMVLIRAVGSYEQSKNKNHFCIKYGLRQKALIEIQKMRSQLVREMNRSFPELDLNLDMTLEPPTDDQIEKLRKILTSSFTDHVARRIPANQSETMEPHLRNAYKCLDLEEPVYIHPSSVLVKEQPEYVLYQDIFKTSRYFMRNVCEIEPEWLTAFASDLCDFSQPLETPSPYYDRKCDKIVCSMTSTFGRWNWELPCVVMPMPSGLPKYSWFAYSLLDGKVCSSFRKFKKVLLSPPNVMLKQWARLLPRTRSILQALVDNEVDSKDSLYETWKKNPEYLLREFSEWLPEEKHMEISCKWPPVDLK